jgi:ornithine carbamoyltransferase
VALATADAKETGAVISVTSDLDAGVKDADVIYTDVWASMGMEAEAEQRKAIFRPYQVNAALMAKAKEDAIFMHCLPAHRGEEVTAQVIDGFRSVVFDQAANRLCTEQAILVALLTGRLEGVGRWA